MNLKLIYIFLSIIKLNKINQLLSQVILILYDYLERNNIWNEYENIFKNYIIKKTHFFFENYNDYMVCRNYF